VEVFRDRALGLPPLTTTLARRMMERTRIWTALQGVRGRPPVDLAALEQIVVRFARLVAEQPLIAEMDINPLLASPERLLALDARVVLHPADVADDRLPRPAIRPYPSQYVTAATLRDQTPVTIRPIRPEDEPRLRAFHATLSDQSVALRYLRPLALGPRTAHERLLRICQSDYDREIALVAVADAERIVGVARLSRTSGAVAADTNEATFSLLVSDEFQSRGLGTLLLRRLLDVARAERVSRLFADVLAGNAPMRHVCARLGFTAGEPHGSPPVVTMTYGA
jgi:acetyltransferase